MQTNELDECRGEWVDIAPETWPCLAESSSLVSVAIVIQPPSEEPDPLENIRLTYPIKRESATPSEMPVSPTESLVPQVILRARNGKVKCWRSTTFAEMFVSSEKHFHIPPEHARFMLGDQVLDPARPLSLYIPDSRTPPPHYIEVIDVRDKESPRGESS
ncbi:hypothetical protein PLICRDRAFT_42311 [Plicaturopsis crispa FD-325 SS-3]|nr:hypothetical protein PLICRDRAFT_42311 [Plicaturopsis crispa FD-325 SS-3]